MNLSQIIRITVPALLSVFMVGGLLTPLEAQQTQKPIVVCSTTQIADFTRQVVGDRWQVICVLEPGEDPHTYDVNNKDIANVRSATLCIQNGWHLEGNEWMQNMANEAGKPLVTCVEGVKPLMTKEEEPVKDPHAGSTWTTQ